MPLNPDRIGFRDGVLSVEGLSCPDLCAEFGTPLYVISLGQIRDNLARLRDALGRTGLAYRVLFALKASPILGMVRFLHQQGLGMEVASLEELLMVKVAGADPGQAVFNGANKGRSELELAIRSRASINVDDEEELATICDLVERTGSRVSVRLRVALPEILPAAMIGDHEPPMRYLHMVKWGMGFGSLSACVERSRRSMNIHLLGVHFHLGLPMTSTQPYVTAVRRLGELLARLHEVHGWWPKEVDLGGGLRCPSILAGQPAWANVETEPVPSADEYVSDIVGALAAACRQHAMPIPTLLLEPGRYLVGSAGILLGRVGRVKPQPDGSQLAYVDASFNHLVMDALLRVSHPVVRVARTLPGETQVTTTITGRTCSPDLLSYQTGLPPLKAGDLVSYLDVGAYNQAMAMQYCAVPRPACVLVDGARALLTARRETLADVIATQEPSITVNPGSLEGAEGRGPLPNEV